MAKRRRKNETSPHSDHAYRLDSLRRRPVCAGRFAGSYFPPKNYSTLSSAAPITRAAFAKKSSAAPFTRAAFAKRIVQQHKESQQLGSAESAPTRLPGEVTELTIGIIGAGMAGLYAALLLDSLGFTNYEILEANPERVGGRVFTRYFGAHDGAPAKKWNYIDFGAMRFPSIKIMDRVIGTEQPWSLTNYLNSVTEDNNLKINLLDYHFSDPNNILYYNSTRKTIAEFTDAGLDPLKFGRSNGGGLDDMYVRECYTTWVEPAFNSFKEELHDDFDNGFGALMRVDHFSVRAYLRRMGDTRAEEYYPQELIDYLETLDSATGHYDDAFSEAVMDSFDFDSPVDPGENSVQWKCVEGGTSQFAHAMESVMRSKPQMNKKVTKIAKSSSPKGDIDVFVDAEAEPRTYKHVINTLPPAVLRSLDTAECSFSYGKRTALRVLHVDSSVKIGLLFKSRWWEDAGFMQGKPMKGGQSSTDLPIRTIVYPSYGVDDLDAPGVLIASYLWGQDAARISSLAAGQPAQLVQLAISNIATVHGVFLTDLQKEYTGQYFIQDWDQYEYSQGAFALFGPGQFKSTFPGLIAPEIDGRYHTAGEMSSVHHAWIVGALNSAWRCVYEILDHEHATEKISKLQEKWGVVEEVDMGN